MRRWQGLFPLFSVFVVCSGYVYWVAVLKGKVPKSDFFVQCVNQVFTFLPLQKPCWCLLEEDRVRFLLSLLALLGVLHKNECRNLVSSVSQYSCTSAVGSPSPPAMLLDCQATTASGVPLLAVPGGFAGLGRIFHRQHQFYVSLCISSPAGSLATLRSRFSWNCASTCFLCNCMKVNTSFVPGSWITASTLCRMAGWKFAFKKV